MTEPAVQPLDKKTVTALTKLMWKRAQKAADPAVSPEDLRSRWKSLATDAERRALKQQVRSLLRSLAKAGWRLDHTPRDAAGAAGKPGKRRKGKKQADPA
jgi:hypothetical protein